MKKQVRRKQPILKLTRETLRQLDNYQLDLVAGGSQATLSFCGSRCLGETCVQK